MKTRQLNIGLAVSPTWLRGEAWRSPSSRVEELFALAPYLEIADAAERAHLDFLFAPDAGHLDPTNIARAPGFSTLDSLVLCTALAARTSRIGIVPTVQTLVAAPYAAARQLMSLQQLSAGRAGWNAVTSLGGLENYGVADRPSAERYSQAAACIETVHELWNSFPAEALLLDREAGVFADAELIRPINHSDEWFRVAGPLAVAASPLGVPPLFQAGGSPSGVAFAGAHADAVFAMAATPADAAAGRRALREAAEAAGRSADDIRYLPGLVFTLAESREEAERLAGPQRTTDGPAHWTVAGTPDDMVAAIAERADVIDGFIGLVGGSYESIELFTTEVVPRLVARGLFRADYTGSTLREHLGLVVG